MKKLFKKSIACLIAVLMVVSSMPFTAITANAALAYMVTGQYDFTSTISDSTFSNAVEGYSGSSYILKGNAWDRDHGLASNSTTFDLKTIYNRYPCITKATSGQGMTFHYDGENDITVAAEDVDLTGLYMYDGFTYIDNIGSYLGGKGFRISWTEQYFSKSSASGAGVFSLGTGNNGDVLKWTTIDNKLYAGGSEALSVSPVDGTVYDITLTSGSDKKISVLVKNHSTNETVIDYTTSGTFEPTSLNYLVIGSVNQSLDKLGTFTLSNLTIEKAYDSSDPTSAFKESADYVNSHIEKFEGYTGTVTQSSDTADKYNATNFWNIPASGIEDKMSNVLYAKGCVNAPYTKDYLEFTAHSKTGLFGITTYYKMKCGGLQYGDMVFLYDGVNDCANIVMSYAYSEASEGGMRNLEPVTSGFSIKSNWHSNGNKTDKSYTNDRKWAFGPVKSKYHQIGDVGKNNNRYFYNTLYYTGTPTQTITTVQNITWRATIYSSDEKYDNKTGENTFGNTNNKDGTTTIYIVNYKPIKDKIDDIKSTYENVKKAGDTAYCAASLEAYYRAVEKVLKLNPNSNSYTYSTNVSAAVTSVGADIDDVVNNYLTTAITEPTKHTRKTVRENEKAATCTAPGSYEEVVKCSKCNVEISRTPKTTPALGHSFTNYVRTVAPTCTKVGTETATCDRCDVTDTRDVAIDESAHNWGNWTKVDSTNHRRVCEYNNDHTQTEAHDMDGNTCRKCDYIAKVTITFVDKDDNSTSTDYAIGADIVIPELPNPNPVYTPNGDGATHTKVTYAWDNEPQTTAQETATYRVVQTTDNADACNFGDTATRRDVIIEDKTYDIFTCTLCNGEKQVPVADKTALNEAILQLQNDLDLPEAGYKYDAALVEAARNLINEANALDRYEEQSVVDAKARELKTAKNELNAAENLAKYTITVQVVNSEDENDEVVKGLGGTYTDIPYGETFTHNVDIPIINDDSSLSGLPKYAVYKWMVGDVKLNTADTSISGVVKGNATYICYVLNFKATNETQTTTRVRYLDKSGHTVDFDRATIGQPYKRKDTSKAPVIPYYTCTGWEPVFGDESNVGTRELVYKPIYTYKDSLANKCEIVGLNDVKVNGEESYQAIYDERIELSGADMFAYADENGSIIARINANYIYAPHIYGVSKTIYITKVETATEKAETIITGTFTTKDDPKYNYLVVNAQFYLPEGATAVESGIVIGKQNDANVLKIGSATKVVSTSQGDNHEYSIQMSYSKNKTGTLYARSYLIYVDGNGDTQTVYSDDITTCILD